jgi:hypothetical protein
MLFGEAFGDLSAIVGNGVLAGFVGTAAVSMVQAVEMTVKGHAPGTTPADAAEKVLGIRALDDQRRVRLARMVHWGYGTAWGLFRSLLAAAGLYGLGASLLHWVAVWGTATVLLPRVGVTPPARQWPAQRHIAEGVLHLIYAGAAGVVCDLMR